MENKKKKGTVVLPKCLSFATDYSCYNCQYMNGTKGGQIWCEYYHGYYDAGYCKHFLARV